MVQVHSEIPYLVLGFRLSLFSTIVRCSSTCSSVVVVITMTWHILLQTIISMDQGKYRITICMVFVGSGDGNYQKTLHHLLEGGQPQPGDTPISPHLWQISPH